jgi:hypothetical protein
LFEGLDMETPGEEKSASLIVVVLGDVLSNGFGLWREAFVDTPAEEAVAKITVESDGDAISLSDVRPHGDARSYGNAIPHGGTEPHGGAICLEHGLMPLAMRRCFWRMGHLLRRPRMM